jgi:hypothetical protein
MTEGSLFDSRQGQEVCFSLNRPDLKSLLFECRRGFITGGKATVVCGYQSPPSCVELKVQEAASLVSQKKWCSVKQTEEFSSEYFMIYEYKQLII